MDVAVWLRSLGLSRHEAAFSDNSIDADILPDLTDGDLAELGVNLGDRKRLLKAIASLSAIKPAAQPTTPPGSSSSANAAERRPITVLFCDLVGSASLAAKLDAEDWRNLVGAYLDAASEAVTGLGGYVLKRLGDGLMALFGYPHAQENDAERAVRAALAIQKALAEMNARNAAGGAPELAARVGLESGPVVVDAAGEVFGEAPNVAARVQGAAEPGTVLVTATVQRQVAGLFIAEDKGAHELKGLPNPLTLYRIVRASGAGRRGGARTLTSLVGREDELSLLMRRWSRTLQGDGQFVQIVGEPGIGKSRLIEEFHAKLADTPHTWVEWASSQLLQNTPLHPLAEWGRQRFGGADLPAERQLAELESTLAQVGMDPVNHAALLAPLVDIPLPPDRALALAREDLRRRQLAAMVAWVLAGARAQPVVLAFEDLHWADPTSLDLMQALAERGGQAPLFVVATMRPEFRAPWAMRSHHGVIALAPLDRAQVRRMVGEIASRQALPPDVVDGVGERTGGVPLFVEEVTRLLLERGENGGAQAIPPTLQQSLAARLDRLGDAREVAQIGAVLGREFGYALLDQVAGLAESSLRSALERLAGADLLLVEGAPPESAYRFKHALIQDAAYDSLLKSRRHALHRRTAEALRQANAEPEAIAHHFTEAGHDDLAIEWWGKAGDQALRRSAFSEAIAHLGKAIAMADKTTGAATPQSLRLRAELGQAVMWAKGPAAAETRAAFTLVGESGSAEVGNADRFAAYYGQWVGSLLRGDFQAGREAADRFRIEAEKTLSMTDLGAACRILGMSCFVLGHFDEARSHLERALRIYDPQRDDDSRFRFGMDTGAGASAYLAMVLWQLGEVDEARRLFESATKRSLELPGVANLVTLCAFKSVFEIVRGDAAGVERAASLFRDLSREHRMPLFSAWSDVVSNWAQSRLVDRDGGMRALREALFAYSMQGNKLFMPLYRGLLAELIAETAGPMDALAEIDASLVLAEETGERWSESMLHRLRGDILAKRASADRAPAEHAYRTAIAIAREQGSRSFGLRAALALAKLYQSTDRPPDACAVLAPALEGFAPTPEMPEIAEAQALLAG
jgi:class 3 adenylate cyclase/tetratricopeptide (TPR) repeat protein